MSLEVTDKVPAAAFEIAGPVVLLEAVIVELLIETLPVSVFVIAVAPFAPPMSVLPLTTILPLFVLLFIATPFEPPPEIELLFMFIDPLEVFVIPVDCDPPLITPEFMTAFPLFNTKAGEVTPFKMQPLLNERVPEPE